MGDEAGAAVVAGAGPRRVAGEAAGSVTDGVALAAGRVADGAGAGAGVGAGTAVGVGAGRAVSIARGRTGTGASGSTGPCTRVSGAGVAPGGSWKSRAACAASGAGARSARRGKAEAKRIIVCGGSGGAGGVNRR